MLPIFRERFPRQVLRIWWSRVLRYTSDSSHGTVAYMLLGTMKGCSFANAEADGSSKAYIKTQQLGSLSNYERKCLS